MQTQAERVLIADLFGVLAPVVTLVIGGIVAEFEKEGASTVLQHGWNGIGYSFLTPFWVRSLWSERNVAPGMLVVLYALPGIFLGGTLGAICMVLTTRGVFLASFGSEGSTH